MLEDLPWGSYVVARLSYKNTSKALISGYRAFWGIPSSGADLYRKQTYKKKNKQTENRCIVVE